MSSRYLWKMIETCYGSYVFDAGTGLLYELTDVEYKMIDFYQKNNMEWSVEIDPKCFEYIRNCGYPESEVDLAYSEIKNKRSAEQALSTNRIQLSWGIPMEVLSSDVDGHTAMYCISLTSECNLRCVYCCYGTMCPETEKLTSGKKMTQETIDASIEFIASQSRKANEITVGFYGGEALIEFELLKRAVEGLKQKIEKKIQFQITTNGLLLNDENRRNYLYENRFRVNVSLDGPVLVNDENRIDIYGHGSFDRILSGLSAMHEKDPIFYKENVGFQATFSPPFERMSEVMPFFESHPLTKDQRLSINRVGVRGTKIYDQYDRKLIEGRYREVILEDKRRIMAMDSEEVANLDLDHSIFIQSSLGMVSRIVQKTSNYWKPFVLRDGVSEQPPLGACVPLKEKMFISEVGDIHLCEKMVENYKLGDVYSGIDLDAFKAIIGELFEYFEPCKKCWATPLCQRCFIHVDGLVSDAQRNVECDRLRRNLEETLKDFIELKSNDALYDRVINTYGVSWMS